MSVFLLPTNRNVSMTLYPDGILSGIPKACSAP